MAIYRGNNRVDEIFAGADKIKEVYKGGNLVYNSIPPDSYLIDINNKKVVFDSDNTPITTFASTSSYASISVNENIIPIRNIKELVFGDSYSFLTTSPSGFCRYYAQLEVVDLSAFRNLELLSYSSFNSCTSLSRIIIGSLDFTNILAGAPKGFTSVPNVNTSFIYANTITLGNAFKSEFSNLSNWTVVVN